MTIAMTTTGTVTATSTAAASGDIDFEDFAAGSNDGIAAAAVGLPTVSVFFSDAVHGYHQQFAASIENINTCP